MLRRSGKTFGQTLRQLLHDFMSVMKSSGVVVCGWNECCLEGTCVLMVRHWSKRPVSFQHTRTYVSSAHLRYFIAKAHVGPTVFLYSHARHMVAAATLTEAEVFSQCNVFLPPQLCKPVVHCAKCNYLARSSYGAGYSHSCCSPLCDDTIGSADTNGPNGWTHV